MTHDIDFSGILPRWIRENTTLHRYNGFIRMDVPMLNDSSDFTSIYIEETKDKIILSDAGDTFSNISMYDFKHLNRDRIIDALENIADHCGANFVRKTFEISKVTNEDNLEWDLGLMVMAMQRGFAVPDIGRIMPAKIKREQKITTAFKNILAESRCFNTPNYKVKGERLTHSFDYKLIIANENKLVKIMSDNSIQAKEALLFEWDDLGCSYNGSALNVIQRSTNNDNDRKIIELDKAISDSNIITFSIDNPNAIRKYLLRMY